MSAAERAAAAYGLLKDLLKVDTTNPPGNESAAADVVARFLKERGVAGKRLAREPGRDNLLCRVGAGGEPLLLAAHLDVVPAEAADWTAAPFAAVEKDGYLYGRGVLDMKCFAAMSAALLAELKTRRPKRAVIGAFLADEEAGCAAGSRFLVAKHAEAVRAGFMLGEGGGFTQYAGGKPFTPVARGEKGHMTLRLNFSGAAGHASVPRRGNAAFRFGGALSRLAPGGLPLHPGAAARDFLRGLGAHLGGARGWATAAAASPALAPLALALMGEELAAQVRPLISHTVSPTQFRGAPAINVIPERIAVDCDVRVLPGFSAEQACGEIAAVVGDDAELEILDFTPGVLSRVDTPLFAAIERAAPAHGGGPALPYLLAGMTDAAFFSRLGTQCYGFSPLLLAEADAGEVLARIHGRDERMTRDAFTRGYALLEAVVFDFLGIS